MLFRSFGEGAANQGQVYETFNIAALWKLPVLFVVENNHYAMGTSVERSAAQGDFAMRGAAFGIPGKQIDGMDVRCVRAAAAEALDWARSGKGPYLLEVQTYRYRGHSMSDPAKYRSKEEVQKMREEHDPIEQVKARILGANMASEDDLKKIDDSIRAVVTEAACIGALGSLVGLMVYLALFAGVAELVRAQTGVVLDLRAWHPVLWICPTAMTLLCALGGVVPAAKAYRTPVAETLAPLS